MVFYTIVTQGLIFFKCIFVLDSLWQPRRVLITRECISLAFVGNEEEIDRIPLEGVDFVKAHYEAALMEGHSHDDSGGQSQDFFCFQVATNAEGYNSGRTYTFRTRSKELYEETLPLLTSLAKKAKRRAQAHTLFRICQWRVRKVYSHSICQSIIALVIMGVSGPAPPRTRPPPPPPPLARREEGEGRVSRCRRGHAHEPRRAAPGGGRGHGGCRVGRA